MWDEEASFIKLATAVIAGAVLACVVMYLIYPEVSFLGLMVLAFTVLSVTRP